MSSSVIVHVVDPADRRASLFADAAGSGGFEIVNVPWSSLAAGRGLPVCDPDWVRLDALSDDGETIAHLVGGPVKLHGVDHTDTLRQALTPLFVQVEEHWGRDRMLTPTNIVNTTFDKATCHRQLQQAGLPVAPLVAGEFSGCSDIVQAMHDQQVGRVFIKPCHGSSASGVVAMGASDGQIEAVTTMVRDPEGSLVNKLGTSRYRGTDAVDLIDELLTRCAVHVERWLPKAVVDGSVTDVRVVTIAGEPCHTVVRASTGPITNLHAGNTEIPTEHLHEQVGDQNWHAMLATCRGVAAEFRGALHLGIDVAFSQDGSQHAVLEVNAFGDLLPRARHKGKTTYEIEVEALASGRFESWRAA